MLTGDNDGNHHVMPERLASEMVWLPRVDGVATGVGENVVMYRVSFTFSEMLPNYRAET